MSVEYDQYLSEHRANVAQAYEWLREHLPDVVKGVDSHSILFAHDQSKNEEAEYNAYDAYFYGGNRSFAVCQSFKLAWQHHIHNNPHHWQHWVILNDEPNDQVTMLDMPYSCIVEMICDWWSFSWKTENLYEIFDWYEEHKGHMLLSLHTRGMVNHILDRIHSELEKGKVTNDV